MFFTDHRRSEKETKSKEPEFLHLRIVEEVKLREAENPWKPQRAAAPTSNFEEEKFNYLRKSITRILNKLTPQNFNTLVDQALKLEIDTEDKQQTLVEMVFQRIVSSKVYEPDYFRVYALMFKELLMLRVGVEYRGACIRKLLINRCRGEYEKTKALEKTINFTHEEKMILHRSVNVIRFLGEAFKQNTLDRNIMAIIIRDLLSNPDNENSLELLCTLLTSVGILELKKNDLRVYSMKMQNLTTPLGKVSLMLLDVIERANGRVPRREIDHKTMDQIQEEVLALPLIDYYELDMDQMRKDALAFMDKFLKN